MTGGGEKEQGFKVEDRRRFDADGRPRPVSEGSVNVGAGTSDTLSRGGDEKPEPQSRGAHDRETRQLNFTSFIVGLASQAFMFLGVVPDPSTGQVRKDLEQARTMIDVLAMLATKTAGNRTEDEDRMIEDLLYELRMRFVHEAKEGKTEGSGQ